MVKCTYCGKNIPQGEGIMHVEISGRIINYCSSKCRKNRNMGREPGKMKWITKRKEE
jgi:large subunit ribosomal protein L24e